MPLIASNGDFTHRLEVYNVLIVHRLIDIVTLAENNIENLCLPIQILDLYVAMKPGCIVYSLELDVVFWTVVIVL